MESGLNDAASFAAALTYAPASPDNPLKGFVPYLRADPTFPHSLEWDYTKLADVMTGPTHFNWAPFDAKLNAAASRGITMTPSPGPPFTRGREVTHGSSRRVCARPARSTSGAPNPSAENGILPAEPAMTWRFQTEVRALAPGAYHLLLRVPHPLPNGPPLRFANTNQDQHLSGWLTLGEFRKQSLNHLRFFESIPWWTLRPDIRDEAVVAGYGEWGRNDYVTAAVTDDRKLLAAYLPELLSVIVDSGFLQGDAFRVSFMDPRTGKTLKTETQKEKKVRRIPSPPAEDLLLIIQNKP